MRQKTAKRRFAPISLVFLPSRFVHKTQFSTLVHQPKGINSSSGTCWLRVCVRPHEGEMRILACQRLRRL